MAAAALHLRRGRLDRTSFLTRIESHIHLVRSAAASPPSPPPPLLTHLGSSIHPLRPPSPSAASIDLHRTPSSIHPHRRPLPRPAPSAASIDSHRTPSPHAIHFAPTVSLQRLSPPWSTPSSFSIGDHCHLVAAVEAGPRALPKGRKATLGIKAARRFLSPATRKVTPSRSLLGSGQTRSFSSGDPSSPEVNQSKPPPVSQLAFRDDREVFKVEWIDDLIPYLKEHSLVTDARTNHLNLEIPNFADHPRYNFSEDTGVPLFQCLIFLALVNNNRGYCVKNGFKKENLLLCPKLKQFRFKKLDPVPLNPDARHSNRMASYSAAAKLMQELLHETVGPDAVSNLLEEPRDLFSKMEYPSDERLIVYHPSLLGKLGRIWFYERLYWFYFKFLAFSKDKVLKKTADETLCKMAYTSPSERSIVDIVKSNPWLEKIDSKKPIKDTVESLKYLSGQAVSEPAQPEVNDSHSRGRMVVALPRHAIEHAFDKHAREVESKFTPEGKPKKLWPYTQDDVVDLLRSILPLHLLKAQEIFLEEGLWSHLEIDSFWPRDLTWMGGVPDSGPDEKVKPSYGKRRIQSRKFDRRGKTAASSSCRPRLSVQAAAAASGTSSSSPITLEAAEKRSLLRPCPVLLTSVAVGSLVAARAASATELLDPLHGPSGIVLADHGIGDWFGGLLFSAGQQANEAVQDQLSALSFSNLAVIFGAGLVTSLSPCTLSVLPLTLGYIGTFGSGKGQCEVVGNSIAFSLGLTTTLAILGVAASFAGKAYGQVGQGLPVAASGLTIVMGLNLLEVVELQLPSFFSDFDPRTAAANLPSSVQAYIAGLTFALAASPCSTPVLTTLLGYVASSRDPIVGGSLLLTYTTGYVAPLLIAASFAGALQSLLSFRRYSAWINPISGAFLLGGGVYTLLDRVFPATSMVM